MLIHANKEELRALAKSFYNVSRTILSIYDANQESICSYPDKMCQFCTEVRKSDELTRRCWECDRIALEKCAETHSVYIYKCHMGLIEVASPIIQSDIIIGYMLFGQITDSRDRSPILDGLEKKAEQHGLDYDKLVQGAQKIACRSPEYIASISKIIEMCANYIWQNSFLSIKNDTAAHALDLYIHENLDRKLSVSSLCTQFNMCRSTLYALSKEYFGCGISEYISCCRIEKAKRLLRDKMPVYQVAEKVGISDTNYFIRFFKKRTGVTPKKY